MQLRLLAQRILCSFDSAAIGLQAHLPANAGDINVPCVGLDLYISSAGHSYIERNIYHNGNRVAVLALIVVYLGEIARSHVLSGQMENNRLGTANMNIGGVKTIVYHDPGMCAH